MQVCPRCGDENSDRARFCQTCGGPLPAQPAGPREIRKTVTILFMDVVGSTELGERLDPESTRRVMSRLFDVVKPVLEHHGGTVENNQAAATHMHINYPSARLPAGFGAVANNLLAKGSRDPRPDLVGQVADSSGELSPARSAQRLSTPGRGPAVLGGRTGG